jgi:glucose-6-phosphate isomerase
MPGPLSSAVWSSLHALAARSPAVSSAIAKPFVSACGLTLDLTRQRIDSDVLAALGAYAEETRLPARAAALIAGGVVNPTEARPVIHTLLREPLDAPAPSAALAADVKQIQTAREAITTLADAVRHGKKHARSLADHAYTDVIVIGIGGSALGPRLVVDALARFADGPRVHFLSNIDGAAVDDLTAPLNPQTTLVVVISKTFTTEETNINAAAVRTWMAAGAGAEAFPHQYVAVTANPAEAARQGYRAEATLSFPVGVGGRFSLWSAVGLPIALRFGPAQFAALLDGAHAMDTHFATAAFAQNLPMLLAAVGLWNRNFQHIAAHAVLPYSERLALLPKHLQQLEMESNGKSVDLDGNTINYPTCPVLFGEPGTNGQHSFHQLLHQGTDVVSADILIIGEREGRSEDQHQRLLANAFAQADALWDGNQSDALPAFRVHHGKRPVSIIELTRLDAFHLGALIALYEHKVFAQGVFWNINSFDQWGVELGKQIAKTLLPDIVQAPRDAALVEHMRQRRGRQ